MQHKDINRIWIITIQMSANKCDDCGKKFATHKNLKYHIDNTVCAEKNIACKNCTGLFTSTSAMYRHMRENCKKNNDVIIKLMDKLDLKNRKLQKELEELNEKLNEIEHQNEKVNGNSND
jgi:hydrogenase maturation factor HypF (carbamoyltransferase family)